MIGLGGSVPIDKSTTAVVTIFDTTGIGLEVVVSGENHHSWKLAFDDAEHLAALLADMARIVRFRAGVGMLEVA